MSPSGTTSSAARRRVVRDPVHGYVEVPAALTALVASPAVQRLRSVAQTSRASVRYPSLTGTRYEHALGTMHLAVRAWRHAWDSTSPAPGMSADEVRSAFVADVVTDLSAATGLDEVTRRWLDDVAAGGTGALTVFADGIAAAVGAVGLLHDLGHPPFSHILEPFFADRVDGLLGSGAAQSYARYRAACHGSPQFHEWAGLEIAERLGAGAWRGLARSLVLRLLADRSGSGWADCLHGIVDGQFDVDRLDYLLRDADRAGTEFGAIDHERLLSSLELHRSADRGWAIGLGARAVSAFETLLVQRAQLYRWVNHHHAVVAADTALGRCVSLVHALSTTRPVTDAALHALAGLLPSFDYLTAALAPPTGTTCADDLALLGWLRRCRPHLVDLAAGADDPDLRRRARTALTLHAMCDGFGATGVPAWRNYQEMLARVEQNAVAVDVLAGAAAAPRAPAHLVTAASRTAYEALLAEPGARLNAALDACLADGPEAGEALLDRAVPAVPGLGEGFWLLARLRFLAVQEEFATVWRGDEESPLSAVSPFPLALSAIEAMRPRWMAYFVPFEAVGDDADKHARRAVGSALLGTLAGAVSPPAGRG